MGWLESILGTKDYGAAALRDDVGAALSVTALAVPQGVAYALIAGLPLAAGLYAACLPVVVGSLFRSSAHVVTGPTNALSLLVGSAVAAQSADPMQTALLLALMVGLIQFTAGVLRLGVLVDYISMPVVVGYITGAGVLIGVGQLPNLNTVTEAAMGAVVASGIVALRWWRPHVPGAILLLSAATAVATFATLSATTLGSIGPIPAGLPPFTPPGFGMADVWRLMPVAVAVTVLSLVESSSVARSISTKTGQRLSLDREFVGQGLANLAAGLTGGYPTSGSLARSAVNHFSGARTRLAGILAGLLMALVLLFMGPVVDHTPVAALAGLLLVVAVDLVDLDRIRKVMASGFGDALAFSVTLLGTWILRLDLAIYLGIVVSLISFLRRARLLEVRRMVVGRRGNLRERHPSEPLDDGASIRIVHVEGQLFFAAASQLENALNEAVAEPSVKVLIVRLKRTQGMDVTTAEVFAAIAKRLASQGRHLLLVGIRPRVMRLFRDTGLDDIVGQENLFVARRRWFVATDEAIAVALDLVDDQAVRPGSAGPDPETPDHGASERDEHLAGLREYLSRRRGDS